MRALFSRGQPNGKASALRQLALQEGGAIRPAAHRPIPRPESVIVASLAQKVLFGWMQNRHQTLYPLVLNLCNMDRNERMLIVGAIALAPPAGEHDPAEPIRDIMSA